MNIVGSIGYAITIAKATFESNFLVPQVIVLATDMASQRCEIV